MPAPGRGPRVVQRSADLVGYSPNLASAVSFRIFSYCGERRSSGATRPHSLATPHPLNLDPVVGMGDTQAGLEAHHPPPWGWCTFRAGGRFKESGDSGVLGQALTSIPCPRSSFSTWLHSSLSFTEDWRGRPYISQTGPPHPSMLGGWLREGQPCGHHTACQDGLRG